MSRAVALFEELLKELSGLRSELISPKSAASQKDALSQLLRCGRITASLHGQIKYDHGTWRKNIFGNSKDGQDSDGEAIESNLIIMDDLYRRRAPPASDNQFEFELV